MTLAALPYDAARQISTTQEKLRATRASTDEQQLSMETIIFFLTITTTTTSPTPRTLNPTTSQSPCSAHPHMEERSSSHSLSRSTISTGQATSLRNVALRAVRGRMVSQRKSNLFLEECSVHSRSFCPSVYLFALRSHVLFVGVPPVIPG